jgi:AAA+ ATPase superfamily predicted ATPase
MAITGWRAASEAGVRARSLEKDLGLCRTELQGADSEAAKAAKDVADKLASLEAKLGDVERAAAKLAADKVEVGAYAEGLRKTTFEKVDAEARVTDEKLEKAKAELLKKLDEKTKELADKMDQEHRWTEKHVETEIKRAGLMK